MKVDDIRKILAVQAIEQTDSDGELLTDADKREVGAMAGAPLSKNMTSSEEDSFLAERAELLLVRTATRSSTSPRWIRSNPDRNRFGVFALVLCGIAATLGFLTNELGPDKRINILSFPLLGILIWSLLIYAREIVVFARKQNRLFRDSWLDALIRFLQPTPAPHASDEVGNPEERILLSAAPLFQSRWCKLTAPVFGARIKALLHFVALILALAAIVGMYFKGLTYEYRAVWESTFFQESSTLRPFLQVILGTAVSLTGDSIPSVAELDAIHWQAEGESVPGENAARWIHWYAITIALFVILPRAILAILWKWKASHLALNLPFREVSGSYFEHLLATSSGAPLEILVVPYSIRDTPSLRHGVLTCLEQTFQRPVEPKWAPAVPFGSEEEVSLPEEDFASLIPLFNFASTPERETHLTLLLELSDASPNPVEHLLLDTTSFDSKSESFADSDNRRKDREAAWKYLLAGQSIEPIFFRTGNVGPTETLT